MSIDLTELQVVRLKLEDSGDHFGTNFEFVLPDSGRSVLQPKIIMIYGIRHGWWESEKIDQESLEMLADENGTDGVRGYCC